MRSMEEWRQAPRAERLARLALTGDELARAIAGQDLQRLTRRPDPVNWAPVEVLCHLRDTEESFLQRFRLALIMDEPRFPTTNPNRWAAERQYLRHHAGQALESFTRRRAETLALLRGLSDPEWERAGVQMDSRGRRTLDDFLGVMAWHDPNHLDQLCRALEGHA
ncbi:MAG TPA: DinB family protein [Methylomirabilota bacterium]|nr:DinB family protein [Methylomirabilota bacterium]